MITLYARSLIWDRNTNFFMSKNETSTIRFIMPPIIFNFISTYVFKKWYALYNQLCINVLKPADMDVCQ